MKEFAFFSFFLFFLISNAASATWDEERERVFTNINKLHTQDRITKKEIQELTEHASKQDDTIQWLKDQLEELRNNDNEKCLKFLGKYPLFCYQ